MQRDERLGRLLADNTTGLDQARIRLMLEIDAADVVKRSDEAFSAFVAYRAALAANVKHAGTVSIAAIEKDRKRLEAAADELVKLARSQLGLLDRPH